MKDGPPSITGFCRGDDAFVMKRLKVKGLRLKALGELLSLKP
jgi:hypothetical protein